MIFNVANTFDSGRPVDRVIDANGSEYTNCMEVDTETGYIRRQVTTPDGRPWVVNGELLTEVVKAAPPIVITFKRGR